VTRELALAAEQRRDIRMTSGAKAASTGKVMRG